MQEPAREYVVNGRHPGGFMRNVLENRFTEAVGSADTMNRKYLVEWSMWLYNDIPHKAWGSREKVEAWIEQGGLSDE